MFLKQSLKKLATVWVNAKLVKKKSKVYWHMVFPISSIKMPAFRFITIHAELCGLFPECKGFSYLLVCINRFTRYIAVYSLCNLKTKSVIIGINSFISTFGQMQHLKSKQWSATDLQVASGLSQIFGM